MGDIIVFEEDILNIIDLEEMTSPTSSAIVPSLNQQLQSRLSNKRAYKDILENLELTSRKKFRAEQPESSADSVTSDETHIIYFEPFLNYPIKVGEHLSMEPTHWALAFLQTNIKNVTEVLCKALFTDGELCIRNQKGCADPLDSLPQVKTLTVMKIAKWMMNKNQDPWVYNYKNNEAYPTKEEEDEMKQVFNQFSSVYQPSPVCNDNALGNSLLLMMEDFGKNSQGISSTTTDDDTTINPIEIERDELFKAYMFLSSPQFPLYSVQVVKDYTKRTIPQNTDIFVDAVQFSKGRWAKAFKKRDVIQMADILFRKYLRADYNDINHKEFTTFSEFCPVKRLAIIRAVAWMKTKEGRKDEYGFDSSIPEHNLFLSDEEIRRIEAHINNEYGKRSNDLQTMEGNVPMEIESPISTTQSPNQVEVQFVSNDAIQMPSGESSQFVTIDPSGIITNPAGFFMMSNENPIISLPSLTIQQVDSSQQDTLSNSSISTCNSSFSYVVTNSPTTGEPLYPIFDQYGDVVFPGCLIKRAVWEKAYDMLQPNEGIGSMKEVGKHIFQETFTDKEIREGCISGRSDKTKFDVKKVDAVFNSLSILNTLKSMKKSPCVPYQVGLVPCNPSDRKLLTTKIFVEHRNYLSKRELPRTSN